MANKIAKVYRETVDGSRRKEIYELFKNKTFDAPEIWILRPEKDTLMIHGDLPLSQFLNEDSIPEGFEVVRVEAQMNTGVTYTDETAVAVRIFIPERIDLFAIKKAFVESVIEVLGSHGVEAKQSSHRKSSNDMVFLKEGREKKFCGVVHDLKNSYLGFIFTFDFGADKIPGLYKMNTVKMLSRGEVSDITEVVGGLHEVAPSLDQSVVDEVISKIALRMNWDLN